MSKGETQLSQPKNPEQISIEIKMEMKRRKISAKAFDRITNGEPDYMGNFKTNIFSYRESLGLFEMFIEKNKDGIFSGIIKDCYGNATVTGKISSEGVSFIKHYLKDESSADVSPVDTIYKGSLIESNYGDYYAGTWSSQDSNDNNPFWLSAKIF